MEIYDGGSEPKNGINEIEKQKVLNSIRISQKDIRGIIFFNLMVLIISCLLIYFILFVNDKPIKYSYSWYINGLLLIITTLPITISFRNIIISIYQYIKLRVIKELLCK